MTKNDLIQMADLVGYDVDDDDDVHAPASGRYGLDPRLEHFAELVAGYALRYERPDMSKKTQNVDTSEKCVHESDKSIHQPWLGLTNEEIAQVVGSPLDEVYLSDFRRVIAKLKEKNGG
jgi:hypothetical protein